MPCPDTSQAQQVGNSHASSIGAGLLLAGFYFLGGQCVLAEVYALNALLLAGLLYCAIAWHQDNDWRWAYTLALLLGLAFNTHLSVVFLLPGLGLFGVVQHWRRFQAPGASALGRMAALLGIFLAAYSLTLYLPVRAHLFPDPASAGVTAFDNWRPFNWGHPADPGRWWYHVTAQQYRSLLTAPHPITVAGHTFAPPWFKGSWADQLGRLVSMLGLVCLQYLWATPLLAWGCGRAFKRRPEAAAPVTGPWFGWALLLTFALNFGIESNYDVGDLSNFFFPAYIVMGIWTGLGLQGLFETMTRAGQNLATATRQPVWPWRLQTVTTLGLVATVCAQWWIFAGLASFRGVTTARDAALDRAAAASRLATATGRTPVLLLLSDDSQLGFWYVHHILGAGPRAITPYGPRRHEFQDNGRLVELVERLQRVGPVAVTQWDDGVARRYPYVLLNQSGSLCLASRRRLPEPARLLAPPASGPALARARFLRSAQYQQESRAWQNAGLENLSSGDLEILRRDGLAVLKREDLVAFCVDFRLPPGPLRALATDPPHRAVQVGWIEVLMARRGLLKSAPSPGQATMEVKPLIMPSLLLWKQRRPLVMPADATTGATFTTTVPLQLETKAAIGTYDVWTRLTYQEHDLTTPWQRTDLARLAFK